MSKNVLVINGADFSQCAVPVATIVDYKKSEYKQPNGYYVGSITVGTTTIDSLFSDSSYNYRSYLFPITQGNEYTIKPYHFGQGSGVLAWAVVDSNNVILDYAKVPDGMDIAEANIKTSEYPTAAKILICCAVSGSFPNIVFIAEN